MSPQPTSEPSSDNPSDSDDSRRQLGELRDRLDRLDQRLDTNRQQARKLTRKSPEAVAAGLEDLQTALDDLATDNRNLHLQLATVIEAIETLSDPAETAPLAAPELQEPGGNPLRRLAGRLLRATVGVARQAWRASHRPATQVSLRPGGGPATNAPRLLAVLRQPPDEQQLAALTAQTEAIDEIFQNDGRSWLALDPSTGRPLSTQRADQIQVGKEHLVVGDAALLTRLPADTLETATLCLRIEDLQMVELQLPAGIDQPPASLLLVRGPFWDLHHGLDPKAAAAFAKTKGRRVLGKVVRIGGAAVGPDEPPTSRFTMPPGVHRSGQYLVVGNGDWAVEQLLRPVVDPPPSDAADNTVLVVLSNPLQAGLDRLVGELLREVGGEARLLIAACSPATALGRERWNLLSNLVHRAFDLESLFEPVAHATALVAFVRRYGVRRVLWIGDPPYREEPGFEPDLLKELAAQLPSVERLHLPLAGPASTLANTTLQACYDLAEPAPGLLPLTPKSTPEFSTTLRAQLDLEDDDIAVVLIADLVAEQRVEDLLTIADQMRQEPRWVFLLGGRGPLARSIDELAGYLGLQRFRRSTAPTTELLAVADIVLSTGEPGVLPYGALDALVAGRPVVGCGLETLLAEGHCGVPVECGDIAGFVGALKELGDRDQRQHRGQQARQRLAEHDPALTAAAWRRVLQTNTETAP